MIFSINHAGPSISTESEIHTYVILKFILETRPRSSRRRGKTTRSWIPVSSFELVKEVNFNFLSATPFCSSDKFV